MKKFLMRLLIFLLSILLIGAIATIFEGKTTDDTYTLIIFCIILIAFLVYRDKKREKKLIVKKYELLEKELEENYNSKKAKLEEEYDNKFKDLDSQQEILAETLNAMEIKIEDADKMLSELNSMIDESDYEYTLSLIPINDYGDITSSEIKNKLSLNKVREKELISSGKAVTKHHEDMTKKEYKAQSKQLIKSFIAETSLLIDKVNVSNFDQYRKKITKCYEDLNRLYEIDNVRLNMEYLEIKLEELNIVHQYREKKEVEKEQQKIIKEQMIEEERVRKEIEREKRKIEKEESQFNQELKKMFEYMNKSNSDIEKKFYIEKIQELESKLKSLEEDKKNVFKRELNTRAGFVYIISNIGSFGENVYKIGMTRRLEPMDRVKELSSASVPFNFDVHAMIFSEDAPSLENSLHHKFKDFAVNKVNERKEFFKIPLSDIKDFVSNEFGLLVEFTEIAKAEEYYKTMEINNKIS